MKEIQNRLFREFENDKRILKLSPLVRANILPVIYELIEKSYKKGWKKGKQEIIEHINKLN